MAKENNNLRIKVPFKKRPRKSDLFYLILIIIISIAVSFAFYKFIYESKIAFLAIPIILLAGIFINLRGIINLLDIIFNLYTITTVVCTAVEYKKDEHGNISDKYSKVYFKDFKSGKEIIYKFRYRTKFAKGSAYRIIHAKLSKTYAFIDR